MVSSLTLVLLFSLHSSAQPQAAPAKRVQTAAAAPAKAESDTRVRGRQWLERADAEASAIKDSGMRGYVYLQLARAYSTLSRPKALELLDSAFNAAAAVPEDSKSKPQVQQQILQAMASINPQHVDELLTQVPSEVRQGALIAMLGYYQETKQIDKAMEMVARITADSDFPYAAANKLMEALPPDGSEREQLFNAAIAAFRDRKASGPDQFVMGDADFGEMVTRHWQTVPPSLVREAIDEILKDARSGNGSLELTIFGQQGSLGFNSAYEWRLFQLLPVLRRIDESAAEDLLKQNQALQAQFQRFPQGMQSWKRPPDQHSVNGIVVTTRDSNTPRTGPPAPPPRIARMFAMVEQMNRALRDVRDHPHEALAQTLAIGDDSTRIRTLILIARATQKSNISVCKSALDKVVEQLDRLQEFQEQANQLIDAGRLYRDIKENDSVKKVVERGGALAEELYKTDTNSDDPNQAVKAFWPSTNAWVNFVRLGAQVAPDTTSKMVNEIPDEEIRPAVRIAFAATLLDAPSGTSTIMLDNKKGVQNMTGRGEETSKP